MIIEIIIIVIVILFMAFSTAGGVGIVLLGSLDIISLICILVLALPMLARHGVWSDLVRGFKLMSKKYSYTLGELKKTKDAIEFLQKQILYAGVITTIFPLIYILKSVKDMILLAPNISVALIAILYTAILELLLLPLQVEAKRQIINYMEEE